LTVDYGKPIIYLCVSIYDRTLHQRLLLKSFKQMREHLGRVKWLERPLHSQEIWD